MKMMTRITGFLLILVIVNYRTTRLFAGNPTDSFSVTAIPGLTTASVMINLQGDDNANAQAAIRYRLPASGWIQAHPGVRILNNRLATSIFELDEGVTYDLEITISDPDGNPANPDLMQFTTRVAPEATGTGNEYFVAPGGNDGGQGTDVDPFATIGHATGVADPGDIITVQDGTYRESIEINGFHGSADPLWIHAAHRGKAVLDGSDETIWLNQSQNIWEAQGSGIFYTPLAIDTGYVACDDQQLYHYESMPEFVNATEGVHEGYFWDGANLFVRLQDDSDPDTHEMAVGVGEAAYSILYSDGIIIDGFTIRYYGSGSYPKGIYLRSSSDCVIRNNIIHNTTSPVWVRPSDAHRNLVENNEIWDTGITSWPWEAVKGSFHENSGIALTGGQGNVARNNTIHSIFNGVYVGNFSNEWDEDESSFSDVHHNTIYDISDDPLEPEGACLQVKFFKNRIENALMGISLAPVNVGPVWIHHNSFWRTRSSGMKLNNSPVGPMLIYNNTFFTDLIATNCISTGESGWSNVILRNNILYGTRYVFEDTHTPGTGNDWDYDLLYTASFPAQFVKWSNSRYYSLAQLQAGTGQEMHGIPVQDPNFENPERGDLTLDALSPAVDQGIIISGINTDYIDSAPDLGAFERGEAGVLSGRVTLERYSVLPPDESWVIPVTVTVCSQDITTTFQTQTGQDGCFSVEIPSGIYDILVKGDHTLAVRLEDVLILNAGSALPHNIGLLREGDADGDNLVLSSDFFILLETYNLPEQDPGFDSRADFNEDGVVTSLDFFLLREHYNQAGENCPV